MVYCLILTVAAIKFNLTADATTKQVMAILIYNHVQHHKLSLYVEVQLKHLANFHHEKDHVFVRKTLTKTERVPLRQPQRSSALKKDELKHLGCSRKERVSRSYLGLL